MNTIESAFTFIVSNYQMIITAVTGLLTGVIGICLLIPGNQPEKFLQSIVDFLTQFSKK